jgi:hypothetical protein
VTLRPSIPSAEFVETHDMPLPSAPTVEVLYRRQQISIDCASGSDV